MVVWILLLWLPPPPRLKSTAFPGDTHMFAMLHLLPQSLLTAAEPRTSSLCTSFKNAHSTLPAELRPFPLENRTQSPCKVEHPGKVLELL